MVGTAGRSGGSRHLGSDNTKQDGGPAKPEMPEAVAGKWEQLLPQLHQPSLRAVDVHELTTLCELLVCKERLSIAMLSDPLDTRIGNQYLKTVDRIHKLSASFGLNPADRKRLDQQAEPQADALDEWDSL